MTDQDARVGAEVPHEKEDTVHRTVGEIDGHEVVVTVTGPEAQDLDDDPRPGSDVLMGRIQRKLTELKDGGSRE